MKSKKTADNFIYGGHDLESMVNAENYYSWVLSMFNGYIGKRVVEVGSGSGSFTSHLLRLKEPKMIYCLEPSIDMFEYLKKNTVEYSKELTVINSVLVKALPEIKNFDTAVYVNVLEHVEKDKEEMQALYKSIDKDGHVLIFVPAIQALLGSFDEQVGHYRRYSKKQLVALMEESGFDVLECYYADLAGVAPWWVSFKLLKRKKLNNSVVKLYDSLAVPIIRTVETFIRPPIGKNLLLVAKKK